MNFAERPPVNLYRIGRFADDLDDLLRDFFRSEMPEPWPTPKPPGQSVTRLAPNPSSRWSAIRSRLALAAAVGLLVVAQWFLADKLPIGNRSSADVATGGGEANRRALKELIKDSGKEKVKDREDLILKPDGTYYRITQVPDEEERPE
jgi:hypothetical protein